jgi:lipoyl(octanoyl) transferase
MKIEWQTSSLPIEYPDAVSLMEKRIAQIYDNHTPELVWLLEHPAIYTSGSSASANELFNPAKIPVYSTGRGGKHTYHGPGQRIIYLMLDLRKREQDLHKYISNLEDWIIASLNEIGIDSKRKDGLIGVWTNSSKGEKKIAAIGVRVRKWITYHGISINVDPELSYYNGIIPCGIKEFGITSLKQLGCNISYDELDQILRRKFDDFF